MSEFKIEDSGERQEFVSGAVRDTAEGKSRPDLISPFFLERLGHHMCKGADKYDAWNWAKGIPNSRCYASAMRHMLEYAQGETNEDHLSAAAFNIMAMIHNQEVAVRNRELHIPTGESLLDFPVFRSVKREESESSVTRRECIYISGPMSGIVNNNIRAFEDAERVLIDLFRHYPGREIEVINPHKLGGLDMEEYLDETASWAGYLARDLDIITTRKPGLIVTLAGWDQSRGSQLEVFFAQRRGIQILPMSYVKSIPPEKLTQEIYFGNKGGAV